MMKYILTPKGIYDLENSTYYYLNGKVEVTCHCKEYEKMPYNCRTFDNEDDLIRYFENTFGGIFPLKLFKFLYRR